MKNDFATKSAAKELSAAELDKVTGGKGAGKATFNPFSITRKIDCSSP
jgi:hypothetical protein